MFEEGIGSFETEIDVVDWRGHARVPGVGREAGWRSRQDLTSYGFGALVRQGRAGRSGQRTKLGEARGPSQSLAKIRFVFVWAGQGDVGPSLDVDSSSSTRRKYATETTNKILQQPDVSL